MTDEGDAFEYAVGDEVLSYHGPLLYKAKVVKRMRAGSHNNYYLHYQGWSKKWDEWVLFQDILSVCPENIELQKQLKKGASAKRKADSEPVPERKVTKSKTKSVEQTTSDAKPHRTIEIPSNLKQFLLCDWEKIVDGGKLVPLPRNPTVEMILDKYLQSKSRDPCAEKIAQLVCSSLRLYFDRCLVWRLLYSAEHAQHDKLIRENKKANVCQIYGAEHLLRLFVKLPAVLEGSDIEDHHYTAICDNLSDVLDYLQKHSTFFCTKYISASGE